MRRKEEAIDLQAVFPLLLVIKDDVRAAQSVKCCFDCHGNKQSPPNADKERRFKMNQKERIESPNTHVQNVQC